MMLGGLLVVHIFNVVFAGLALLVPTLHRFGENAAAIALASRRVTVNGPCDSATPTSRFRHVAGPMNSGRPL
jgi:hypothetical protein